MNENLIRKVYWTIAPIVFFGCSLYFINPFKKTEWPEFIRTPKCECVLGAEKQLKELGAGCIEIDVMNRLITQNGPDYQLVERNGKECYWKKIKEKN